jgi:hypothetical protein
MESKSESRQNETTSSDKHNAKHRSPIDITDDGISILSSFTQAQNARISMDDSLEFDLNLTKRTESHQEKQYAPSVSISSTIVTSVVLPQYRTIKRPFEFTMKWPFMWKYGFPLSMSICRSREAGKLPALIFSTDAGMQI